MVPWCCFIDEKTGEECLNKATRDVIFGDGPEDSTQACDEHAQELGESLAEDDFEVQVLPIQ